MQALLFFFGSGSLCTSGMFSFFTNPVPGGVVRVRVVGWLDVVGGGGVGEVGVSGVSGVGGGGLAG